MWQASVAAYSGDRTRAFDEARDMSRPLSPAPQSPGPGSPRCPSRQWELDPLEPQGGSTIHYSSTLPSMIFSLKHDTLFRMVEEAPMEIISKN